MSEWNEAIEAAAKVLDNAAEKAERYLVGARKRYSNREMLEAFGYSGDPTADMQELEAARDDAKSYAAEIRALRRSEPESVTASSNAVEYKYCETCLAQMPVNHSCGYAPSYSTGDDSSSNAVKCAEEIERLRLNFGLCCPICGGDFDVCPHSLLEVHAAIIAHHYPEPQPGEVGELVGRLNAAVRAVDHHINKLAEKNAEATWEHHLRELLTDTATLLQRLAARSGDGWQPMETAPQDGTEFLAAVEVKNNRTGAIHWERHVIAFEPEVGNIDPAYEQGWGWGDYSHWQPLPTAPSAEVER